MRTYPAYVIADVLKSAEDAGYQIIQVAESVIGYGHMILLAPEKPWTNVEIREIVLNEWLSGYTVRKFSKISKRIEQLLSAPV